MYFIIIHKELTKSFWDYPLTNISYPLQKEPPEVFRGVHLKLATLLKKRLWHRHFLVNFAKFLRTPFIEHFWWLLLQEVIVWVAFLMYSIKIHNSNKRKYIKKIMNPHILNSNSPLVLYLPFLLKNIEPPQLGQLWENPSSLFEGWRVFTMNVNPFHVTGLFLYPLESLENIQKSEFSGVFRGYKKRPVA